MPAWWPSSPAKPGRPDLPPVTVALEIGTKRVFAVAVEWPGWSRAGRSEQDALEALAAYAARFAAAVDVPALAEPTSLDVVERLQGGGGTDFGVPGSPLAADDEPLDASELHRQTGILRAAWGAFDAAAQAATGRELRKGPRGGGRDLAKMVGHVLEADEAYLTQLGSRRPSPQASDTRGRMRQVREAAVAALVARAAGRDPAEPNRVRRRWSPRYFIRRSAWHALDHAWEIEDRLI